MKLRFLFYLPAFCLFFSCNSKSNSESAITRALNESLEVSAKRMQNDNESIFHAMDEKLQDPATVEKAKLYMPKIELLKLYSRDATFFIDSVKYELIKKAGGREKLSSSSAAIVSGTLIENGLAEKLYEILLVYKEKAISVDERLKEYSGLMVVGSKEFDSLKHDKRLFVEYFFSDASVASAFAFLNSCKVSVLNFQNICFSFFNNQVMSYDHYYEFYWPMLGVESTVIEQHGKMKITAGIGSFSYFAKPEMEIYGKKIKPNESGIIEYEFRENRSPGKYYLPIKISYIDQDGKAVTRVTTISYTVK
jgi:hypothetical protein